MVWGVLKIMFVAYIPLCLSSEFFVACLSFFARFLHEQIFEQRVFVCAEKGETLCAQCAKSYS